MRAVLWDLDGTLISTRRLYIEAYSRALRPYMKRDLTEDDVRSVKVVSELRLLQALAREDYEACLLDFQRHYAELHDTHFDGVYDGVLETLDALRSRELKLGVVTGKSRSSWEVSIATADLGQFDVLIMDDDVDEPKPHPQGILAALEALDVAPEEAIYVGDSMADVIAAREAGVLPAAALWSKSDRDRETFTERVNKAGGASFLDTPPDLLSLL